MELFADEETATDDAVDDGGIPTAENDDGLVDDKAKNVSSNVSVNFTLHPKELILFSPLALIILKTLTPLGEGFIFIFYEF